MVVAGLNTDATGHGAVQVTQAQTNSGWTQQAKLAADDGQNNDRFGQFVSLSADGSTALIGAPNAPNSAGIIAGAVYVFNENGNWSQQTKLTASDSPGLEFFGRQVALSADGSTAVIGAFKDIRGGDQSDRPGAAYVFTRSSGNWSQQRKLLAEDGDHLDEFGWSVAVSDDGETAVIGAFGDDDQNDGGGSAYVFTRGDGSWSQQTKLVADDNAAEDSFGDSVAVSGDGDTAVVGAWFDDNSNGDEAGSAYVFKRDDTGWNQQAKILANDGGPNERFGGQVAVSGTGNTAMFNAAAEKEFDASDPGVSTYAFTRDGDEWTQQSKLSPPSDNDPFAFGGPAVSGDGDTAVMGASGDLDPNGDGSDSAYIFIRDQSGSWSQQTKIAAGDGDAGDAFGDSVAMSENGNTAVVGAFNDEDPNGEDAGSAYVFTSADGSSDNGMLSVFVSPSLLTAGEQTDVTVTVENESGGAVANVAVEITDLTLSATTDTNGEATLSLSSPNAGDYVVSASADGYTDATATLTIEDDSVPTDPTERVLQITGKSDPSQLTQNDVTATITRFNRGQSVNGVTVTQNDVTAMITLFERN